MSKKCAHFKSKFDDHILCCPTLAANVGPMFLPTLAQRWPSVGVLSGKVVIRLYKAERMPVNHNFSMDESGNRSYLSSSEA